MNLTPINDFFTNIKEKLTNPFFGTLIFVWLVRNWELVYTLFNFDNDCTLADKKSFIRDYYYPKTVCGELFTNIGVAILLMLLGYILVIGTRTLVTWIEFGLMPLITKKVINEKVVLKELHDEVSKERDEYSEMYEEQRKQVRALSKQFDEISNNYQSQSKIVTEQTELINNLTNDNSGLNSKLVKSKEDLETSSKKLNDKITSLELENTTKEKQLQRQNFENQQFYDLFRGTNSEYWKPVKTYPLPVENAYQDLIKDKQLERFYVVADYLTNGGSIGVSTLYEMEKYNVIYKDIHDNFTLSPIGFIINKYKRE
jgi:hypothetical protein